ncbi:Fe2OG dioxygenase domain-containing protein [Mycena chlorophos]|uniref:Fe2OG dioxygenase domain-containing protein n=1 Tax=Mycena chlorophos TaxID=658473 RepID=A0A8H6SKR0_MYCCL|nr:Fe2OG dioxygenase domain-containing protein [Mycena chlorophos]
MPPKRKAPAATAKDHLDVLRKSLQQSTPWTSGVLDVRGDDLSLFYKYGEGEREARLLNLEDATDEHLEELAAACQPATFGRGQEDVLDENYRKAGKLDCANFASSLDIASLQVIDAISPDLLDGRDDADKKIIRPELYKLNVYGPGSFFKSHKDTPRSKDMIGSLVIVLPTTHEGGELSLSHGSESSTFDSALDLADKKTSIAYVAFFSDVMHAVEKVTSGYRVTLTYNLFLIDRPDSRLVPARQPSAAETACEAALRGLVADPTFLPAGGILGFGLTHQYPIPRGPRDPQTLKHVLKILKGADARMHGVALRVGLETSLYLVYDTGRWEGNGHYVGTSEVVNLEGILDEGGESVQALEEAGEPLRTATESESGASTKKKAAAKGRSKKAKRDSSGDEEEESEDEGDKERTAVHWVTKVKKMNRAVSAYVAMGNEADLAHHYGDAALFVRFPAAADRGAL